MLLKECRIMIFLRFSLSFPSHPREIIISLEMLLSKPLGTEGVTLHSPYPDIPPVDMVILSPSELLANKVSAIYKRNKPRDVHDIYILLKLGTKINMNAIYKRTAGFNLESFEKKILEKRNLWDSLKPLVITKLPEFEKEFNFILNCFKNI